SAEPSRARASGILCRLGAGPQPDQARQRAALPRDAAPRSRRFHAAGVKPIGWGIAERAPGGSRREARRGTFAPMPDYTLSGHDHVRQYEAPAGKVGHDWNGTSVLILHVKGRKSGKTRKFPLIYGRDASDYVIVASKGGAPDHPGWYKNLLAHPDAK